VGVAGGGGKCCWWPMVVLGGSENGYELLMLLLFCFPVRLAGGGSEGESVFSCAFECE